MPLNVGGRLSGSLIVYESRHVCVKHPTQKQQIRRNSQLLDSPGPRERSTANIAGCTSKVGKGSSGSTSPPPELGTSSPNTLGLLILPPNLEEAGDGDEEVEVDAPPDIDDVLQRPEPEAGEGLEIEDTNEVGERIDKSPEAEKDLVCDDVR